MNTSTQTQALPKNNRRRRNPLNRLNSYLFTVSFVIWTTLHEVPAFAQFFSQGETYANDVFPAAQPITALIIGAIRLIFIYLIGSRAVRIVSGSRGEDKVSDLATEIAVIFVTVLAIDAVLLLILP